MQRALIVLCLIAGCGGDSYLVVTVDARPAVHDAAQLAITLKNGGTMRTDMLSVGSHAFPLTFSISAPGRSGDLDITVEAQDSMGLAVGLGSTTATVASKSAELMLDSTDFVVNSDPAMDQFLASGDYEAAGLQLGANADGTWTVGFRDNCNQTAMCNILARKFDQDGVPQQTAVGASNQQFVMSTTLTTDSAYPAVASNSQSSTVVAWDYTDTVGTGHGIACRSLDATGNASSGQISVATDDSDVVTAAALSNDNFALSWQTYTPAVKVRTIIVRPDCTPLTSAPVDVSTVVGTLEGPHRSHIASNNGNVMYVWIVDGDVHIRPGTNSAPSGTDTTLLTHTMQYEARIARIAPFGTGFAVVVRWGNPTMMGPGKIEMFQIDSTGMIQGSPLLITDQSLSDFASGSQSFGVATRSDGVLMVAWHQCDAQGTPGTCDVYGRFVDATGTPIGDPFMVPTTTLGDQTGPSVVALPGNAFVVAWTDESHDAPDTQGKAVRARVVYTP